jgi:phage-related protein
MRNMLSAIPVVFWRNALGREPVHEWLCDLSKEERRVIGFDLRTLQVGWPIGMPLCRSLGNGLWELRSTLPSNRISRIIFCFHQGELVLLNGFIKKTQKTPMDELELAKKRMKGM